MVIAGRRRAQARSRRTTRTTIEEDTLAETARGRGGLAGIGMGGILVIVGIVVALVWSTVLGIIIALVGLIAFGGFAKGKWY